GDALGVPPPEPAGGPPPIRRDDVSRESLTSRGGGDRHDPPGGGDHGLAAGTTGPRPRRPGPRRRTRRTARVPAGLAPLPGSRSELRQAVRGAAPAARASCRNG